MLLAIPLLAAAPKAPKVFDPYETGIKNCSTQWACDVKPVDKIVVSRSFNSIFEPARRGCCSQHSGTCGCTSGRTVCCDGTLSPSCGCD